MTEITGRDTVCASLPSAANTARADARSQKKVAKELGINYYDKDIIAAAAKVSYLDASVIEREGEELTAGESFWQSITPISYDHKEHLFEVQREVILDIAAKEPCLILGRCADVILNEAGIDSLDVFVYADEAHRAERVAGYIESRDLSEIVRTMKRVDRNRRAFYEHYTGQHWGACKNYTMALDSGMLGVDTCVKLICAAARSEE